MIVVIIIFLILVRSVRKLRIARPTSRTPRDRVGFRRRTLRFG